MSEAEQTDWGGPPPTRAQLVREIWVASIGILLLLGLIKHLGAVMPVVRSWGFTLALGLQLYVPLFLRGRRAIDNRSLGLRLDRWRTDLAVFAAWAAVVTVPFALGHHLWQTELMGRPFRFAVPDDLLQKFVTQTIVVAVAEEVFYRGYLQERFERLWPAKRRLFGAPFGAAILASSAVFALAHFVGEYAPTRLGPFFPSLLFGLARARSGSVLGAIGLHAYFNLLGDFVWASYR